MNYNELLKITEEIRQLENRLEELKSKLQGDLM